jgi:hypothetical protein
MIVKLEAPPSVQCLGIKKGGARFGNILQSDTDGNNQE